MTSLPKHVRRILLVEDMENIYGPIQRWLADDGYEVFVATTFNAAMDAITGQHFHLAIVDVRLEDDDPENDDGLTLLYEIEQRGLNEIMPCIVLTAYDSVNNVLVALQEHHAARFIQKTTGYRQKLLDAVADLFEKRIKINFDLGYDVNSDALIAEIAADVNWSMSAKPELEWLAAQVQDLFGRLFYAARRVHITKLTPGLTGSAIIRVQPTWRYGLGQSYVAKIGRRDKVEIEAQRFEEYVSRFLPQNMIAQVKDTAYTRQLGALLYTFAENDTVPLREFDEYYAEKPAVEIINSLQNLFDNTCRYWYDAPDRAIEDLPDLYYKAFRLDEQKLVQRIQVVLPAFDPAAERIRLAQPDVEIINPIAWLRAHRRDCVMPAYHCITHGDLNGRNIMVDQNGKCWLIDFYRTYRSHILRDFVILETDIKYRLMDDTELSSFVKLEQALLSVDEGGDEATLNVTMPATARKAMIVINAMRALAYQYAGGVRGRYQGSRKEYLISLLMATLNVARLRHIPEERKLQAMLSASLICAELDEMAGRHTFRPEFELRKNAATATTVISSRPGSAQQRFLADQIDTRQVMLFIGSENVGDVGGGMLDKLAAIPWRIVFTTNRHDLLEKHYQQAQRPYHVTTRPPRTIEDGQETLICKLYGSVHETMGHRDEEEGEEPRSHRFMRLIRQGLQEGVSLLMLCASRAELMMVRDACYQAGARGFIWVAGADFPEEEQDDYRRLGLRVLPDTPQDLVLVLYRLVVY